MGSRELRDPSPHQLQIDRRPRCGTLRFQQPITLPSPAFAESSPALAVDLLFIRTISRRDTVVRGIAVLHCHSALRERRARRG
jgi:hypothetical protein